jgi:hypothetical protein
MVIEKCVIARLAPSAALIKQPKLLDCFDISSAAIKEPK